MQNFTLKIQIKLQHKKTEANLMLTGSLYLLTSYIKSNLKREFRCLFKQATKQI